MSNFPGTEPDRERGYLSLEILVEVELARHDERLNDIENWKTKQNGTLEKIQNELQHLREDWGKRPTWTVTTVIGVLSTLCGSMAVYIVTHI